MGKRWQVILSSYECCSGEMKWVGFVHINAPHLRRLAKDMRAFGKYKSLTFPEAPGWMRNPQDLFFVANVPDKYKDVCYENRSRNWLDDSLPCGEKCFIVRQLQSLATKLSRKEDSESEVDQSKLSEPTSDPEPSPSPSPGERESLPDQLDSVDEYTQDPEHGRVGDGNQPDSNQADSEESLSTDGSSAHDGSHEYSSERCTGSVECRPEAESECEDLVPAEPDSSGSSQKAGIEDSEIETGQNPQDPDDEGSGFTFKIVDSEGNEYDPSEEGRFSMSDLKEGEGSRSCREKVKRFLSQILSQIEVGRSHRDGFDKWDKRKVVKSIAMRPDKLPRSKCSREKLKKTSLWVDISGSVSHLSGFIIDMMLAVDKHTQLVVGSEAHPQVVIPRDEIHRYEELLDSQSYIKDFADQIRAFFKSNRLEPGSTIVIWSDFIDIGFEPEKVKHLLKPFKVVWLCALDREEPKNSDYPGHESLKVERCARLWGHTFLWGFNSARKIRRKI